MRRCIAVVGGGISGLAAAFRLAHAEPKVEIVLLEADGRLGGVLETTRQNGFLVEGAADNFLSSPPAAVDLCRRLGIEQELVRPDPTRQKAFVVRGQQLQPIPVGFQVMAPTHLWPVLTSRILSMSGKLRLGLEYFLPPKTDAEDESLASFVRRRFGREVYERLVQPLVGGIYTADAERLSIESTMPRFRQMERDHGSLMRAMFKKKTKGQREENASGARYGQFVAPKNGMSGLVDAIAQRLPPQSIRLNAPVESIVAGADGRWLVNVGNIRPSILDVDGVVIATPAHRSSRMLQDLDPLLARQLASIEYGSCAVVSLGYRREQIGHPLDGFGFVVPLIEQRLILSCSFSSIKYADRAPKGFVLLRVFIGGECQSELLRLGNEPLIELAEREIAPLLTIRGKPMLRVLVRRDKAMPQYRVGHREIVANVDRRIRRYTTLALAGNAFCGVGIPSCIQSGQDAADRILAGLPTTPTTSETKNAFTEK